MTEAGEGRWMSSVHATGNQDYAFGTSVGFATGVDRKFGGRVSAWLCCLGHSVQEVSVLQDLAVHLRL